jgi:hypothetical protein
MKQKAKSGTGRFRTLRRLHSFQPGQTSIGVRASRVAVFLAASIYPRAGVLAQDWGGGGFADNGNFGERGANPDCAPLYPGYGLVRGAEATSM